MDNELNLKQAKNLFDSGGWKAFTEDLDYEIGECTLDLIEAVNSSKEQDNFVRGKLQALYLIKQWQEITLTELEQEEEKEEDAGNKSESESVWRSKFHELGRRSADKTAKS